jgi:hypothetical protein
MFYMWLWFSASVFEHPTIGFPFWDRMQRMSALEQSKVTFLITPIRKQNATTYSRQFHLTIPKFFMSGCMFPPVMENLIGWQ